MFIIGLNLCWADGRGLDSYAQRFAKLHAVGGNFARVWTTADHMIDSAKAGGRR